MPALPEVHFHDFQSHVDETQDLNPTNHYVGEAVTDRLTASETLARDLRPGAVRRNVQLQRRFAMTEKTISIASGARRRSLRMFTGDPTR
jgi:hypothetical protein